MRLWPFSRRSDQHVVEVLGRGTFTGSVVSESHYQDALKLICGGRTAESARLKTEARLVPEDSNPYDAKAVGVWIDGNKVGHLDRLTARVWRKTLAKNGNGGCTARCQALIVGGWDRGPHDRGHYDVRLDLP
jgi:hypothetical protein